MNFSILTVTRTDHRQCTKLRGDILTSRLFLTVQFQNQDSLLRVLHRSFMRVLRLRVSTSVMGGNNVVLHSVVCVFFLFLNVL